jgi:hypothetical protein
MSWLEIPKSLNANSAIEPKLAFRVFTLKEKTPQALDDFFERRSRLLGVLQRVFCEVLPANKNRISV